MKLRLLALISLFNFGIAIAQITNEPPVSNKLFLKKAVPVIEMPSFDLKKLQDEDAINDRQIKPYRFGHQFEVDLGIDNSGSWEKLPNGDRIWRVSILSKGAITLNFIFDHYNLAEGATVHLYDDHKKFVLGAYTSKMNNENNSLGTWIADGEKITIELYEPENVKGKSKLHIGQVVHGYRSVSNYQSYLKSLNQSGPCNLDINCDVGSDFNGIKEKVKKGVALILNNGSDWCTGTLINNTRNDKAPYLLTANHCRGGEANWTFRFNWISTNTVCASTENSIDNGPSNYFQTTSGATVLAQNDKTDFELVEITGGLDDAWDLEWVGWDRTGGTPDFTVGIHHPSGDIMKVCRDNNAPEKTLINFENPQTEMWRIIGGGSSLGWDLGVTERGSSGSALFDPNGRIIGQLAGGFAACSGTDDNGTEDWYGRFDISWSFGNSDNTRLSNWLDPVNTGQLQLNMLSEADSNPDPPAEDDEIGIIFPNPSRGGKFTITNSEENILKISVYDIRGKIVSSKEVDIENPEIDLSTKRSGIYFLYIENISKGETFKKKIIIY